MPPPGGGRCNNKAPTEKLLLQQAGCQSGPGDMMRSSLKSLKVSIDSKPVRVKRGEVLYTPHTLWAQSNQVSIGEMAASNCRSVEKCLVFFFQTKT